MSESDSVDTRPSPTQANGAGAQTYHGRLADLLDDVTVSARPVTTAEETFDDLFAPTPPPPLVAPPPARPQPVPTAWAEQPTPPLASPVPSEPAVNTPIAAAPVLDNTAAAPVRDESPSAPVSAPPERSTAESTPVESAPGTGAAAGLVFAAPSAPVSAPPGPSIEESAPGAGAAAGLVFAAPSVPVSAPPERSTAESAPAESTVVEGAPGAGAAAGLVYATWVPPWDESLRQPVTPLTPPVQPPAADAPLTTPAAPPAAPAGTTHERSIFAPLAAAAIAAAEPSAGKPPADLPPFLAAGAAAKIEQASAVALAPADGSSSAPATAGTATDAPEALLPATAAAEAASVELAPVQAPGAPTLVSIRGRMDGLAIEVGDGPWPEVVAALTARLGQSATFFRNANVAVELGPRTLVEEELNVITGILRQQGMTLALLRTSVERTFQAALALGLTVTLTAADGAAMAEASAAVSNVNTGGYFVYRGYLRSGNRLRRQEHVLVIGDVNPGAEVISDGDVLVWGRLRGIVHAGASGNVRAIVAALDMEPTQLRIADVMVASADPQPGQPGKWFWQRSAHKRPEVARLVHKAITFEEWDANRPGGLVSLRRGG